MMLTDDILNLYRVVVEEEHYFLGEHQKRIAYYAGLLTALAGGTAAGLMSAAKWYHFLLLNLGPIAFIEVSRIAKKGTERMYQRFLEAVTVRAKIEERYGMANSAQTKGGKQTEKGWVKEEPLVTQRHLKSREEGCSSLQWVYNHLHKPENYHGVTIRLLDRAAMLGWFLLLVTLVATICEIISAIKSI